MTSELFAMLVIIDVVGFTLWFAWWGVPWLLRDCDDESIPFDELMERVEREDAR